MNEHETPLREIAWQRFGKSVARYSNLLLKDGELRRIFVQNWYPLAQAALVTLTAGLLVQIHPIPKKQVWKTVKSGLPGFEQHYWWYTAAAAAVLAFSLNWISGLSRRAWHYISKRFWKFTFAAVSLLMISSGGTADSYPSLICASGYFGFVCTVFAWLQQPVAPPSAVQDEFHRNYFVNRLAEIFRNSESRVRRIAILGEWGSGKTRLLELLAQRLHRDPREQFRTGFVNPWKARTADEAWALVAAEVDRAMGYTPLLPKIWATHPLLRGLINLMPLKGVSTELVKLLASSGGESRDAIIAKVNNRLSSQRCKVVLLIDDMERTDPSILRQLFPIIDQLAELHHLHFVFAIDPSRIAHAFGEKNRCETLTKGFLDKVFDLQIELPAPMPDDVRSMVEAEARKHQAHKLVAALPSFSTLLPANPRLALRFLEFAVTNERLFLDRYGADEKHYAAIFLSWLANVEFPGFLSELVDLKAEFSDLCNASLFSKGTPTEPSDKLESLRLKIHTKLSLGDDSNPVKSRLTEILNRLAELSGNFWDNRLKQIDEFDPEWALTGYSIPTELSFSERKRLCTRWKNDAGVTSIETMLRTEFKPEQITFVDYGRCAQQLLQLEVQAIQHNIRLIRGNSQLDVDGLRVEIIASAKRLKDHHQFAKTQEFAIDIKAFEVSVFPTWIEGLAREPLDLDTDSASDMDLARTTLSFELATSLPLSQAWKFAQTGIRETEQAHLTKDQAVKTAQHFQELRKHLFSRVTERALYHLKHGTLGQFYSELGFPQENGVSLMFGPAAWIGTDTSKISEVLDSIVNEATENETLALTCAEICEGLFLHPLACNACMGLHSRERPEILQLQSSFPGYIAAFWKAGLKLPETSPDRGRLLCQRKEAITLSRSKGPGLPDEVELSVLFPLDPVS